MDNHRTQRRNLLKAITVLSSFGITACAQTGGTKTAYDPAARFELKVSEVEYRRHPRTARS